MLRKFVIFLMAWIIGIFVICKMVLPLFATLIANPYLVMLATVLLIAWTCACTVVASTGRER
jgi:hypothetical protein